AVAGRRLSRSSSLTCLPRLAADVLSGVANALALVRLGGTDLAHVGSHLADQLLVDAGHRDLGRFGHLEGDPRRSLERHRMAEPALKLEILSLQLGPIADALDLQVAPEAFGDTGDHVGQQGT